MLQLKKAGRLQPTTPSVCYRGEEHGEAVDGGLGDVEAPDGHDDGGQERQVAEREQQSGDELAAVRQSRRIVSASPTLPACRKTNKHAARV